MFVVYCVLMRRYFRTECNFQIRWGLVYLCEGKHWSRSLTLITLTAEWLVLRCQGTAVIEVRKNIFFIHLQLLVRFFEFDGVESNFT